MSQKKIVNRGIVAILYSMKERSEKMANKITKLNFQTEVLEAEQPVLIDFFANWCAPCQMLSPVIDEIASEHPSVKVCKVDIDQEMELAASFQVMSIPTLVVMKHGKLLQRAVGVQPKKEIMNMLEM